jgi:hypothetical protein
MPNQERRNIRERAARLQRLIKAVVENPSVTLNVATLQVWLGVHMDAAQRILSRMVASGLVREVSRGVFVPGAVMGVRPLSC